MIVRGLFFLLFLEVKKIIHNWSKAQIHEQSFYFICTHQMTHFLDLINAKLLITSSTSILSKSSFSMQSWPLHACCENICRNMAASLLKSIHQTKYSPRIRTRKAVALGLLDIVFTLLLFDSLTSKKSVTFFDFAATFFSLSSASPVDFSFSEPLLCFLIFIFKLL